jgi:hypothetical protein
MVMRPAAISVDDCAGWLATLERIGAPFRRLEQEDHEDITAVAAEMRRAILDAELAALRAS